MSYVIVYNKDIRAPAVIIEKRVAIVPIVDDECTSAWPCITYDELDEYIDDHDLGKFRSYERFLILSPLNINKVDEEWLRKHILNNNSIPKASSYRRRKRLSKKSVSFNDVLDIKEFFAISA